MYVLRNLNYIGGIKYEMVKYSFNQIEFLLLFTMGLYQVRRGEGIAVSYFSILVPCRSIIWLNINCFPFLLQGKILDSLRKLLPYKLNSSDQMKVMVDNYVNCHYCCRCRCDCCRCDGCRHHRHHCFSICYCCCSLL